MPLPVDCPSKSEGVPPPILMNGMSLEMSGDSPSAVLGSAATKPSKNATTTSTSTTFFGHGILLCGILDLNLAENHTPLLDASVCLVSKKGVWNFQEDFFLYPQF